MTNKHNSRNFKIQILPNNLLMGKAVAKEVGKILRSYTSEKGLEVMAVFAAAPSQDTFLAQLCREKGIDWEKVNAFHLDEYLDLPKGHPNTFQIYLQKHIFGKVPIPQNNVHYIKDIKSAPEKVSLEYAKNLKEAFRKNRRAKGVYLAFIGIGVNGHIAFNEPGTDLRIKKWTVRVKIDKTSVRQQFDDYRNHPDPAARYKALEDVPRKALTITCAGILAADIIFCMAPGKQKAAAVKSLLEGCLSNQLPASLLRLHENTHLYLDHDSAGQLNYKPTPIKFFTYK